MPHDTMASPDETVTHPRRDVDPLGAAMITVGAMIGSGIFYTPAEVARRTGSTARALAVWAAGALLSLLGAFCVAELGAAIPTTGGMYVYLRRAYGTFTAFLFGWSMLAVLVPSSVAFFAGVTARHLAPALGLPETFVTVGVVALVAGVNVWGVRAAAGLQSATALAKYAGLAVVAVAAFVADPATVAAAASAPAPSEPMGAWEASLAAVVPVLWAYDGWVDVTSVAGEVRDPGRVVPRALIAGTLAVGAVYLLVVAGYHHALGTGTLAASRAPGNDLGVALAGGIGLRLMAALVALSTFGGCVIGMLTGTRVVAAMGQDGAFFPALGTLSARGTPSRAIVLTAALAVAYALSSRLGQLAEMFVVGAWPFYGLTAIATMILRRREPALARPFRTPLYPWSVLGFLAAIAVMLVSFTRTTPVPTLVSFAVIATAIPVYGAMRLRARASGR